MFHEHIEDELHDDVIKNHKGCLLLDAGIIYSWANIPNNPVIFFSIDIDGNPLQDVKLNHRYPNKGYYTISRKYGRRVSQIGYPYYVDLNNELQKFMMTIHAGIGEDVVHLNIPVQVLLTQEKPVCGLSIRCLHENRECVFRSCCRNKNNNEEWLVNSWHAIKPGHQISFGDSESTILESPEINKDTMTLTFAEEITPFPQEVEELVFL